MATFCAALSATAIGGVAANATTAQTGTHTSVHSSTHAGTNAGTQTVSYLGRHFTVPASWPVIDLGRAPSTCVRFDQHAVYLGAPGSRQNCPPRVVGRTETLLIQPAAAFGQSAHTTENPVAQEFDTTGSGFQVTVTFGSDRALARSILASAALPMPASAPTAPSTATGTAHQSPGANVAVGAVVASSTNFTGSGFDTCSAPDSGSMSAWKSSSPYSAVGIYIGGVNSACSQPNLTPGWVSQQAAAGWRFLPLYVGLQGPGACNGCSTISDPSQGTAAADDAANDAAALGFPTGIEITYDMEGYNNSGTNASLVVGFEAAWSAELHARGYQAGIYGSMSSTVADLVNNYTSSTMPDVLDFASVPGSGGNTVSDPAIPAGDWPNHQRIHQYTAGHNESYGGATLNVDDDYFDVQISSASAGYTPNNDSGWSVYDSNTNATTVFGMGSDGRIGFSTGAGVNWSNWSEVSNMWVFPTTAKPTAVYNPDTKTSLVFARGTDGSMGVSTRPDGASTWSSWTEMNAYWKLAGDPSAVYNPNTRTLTVFALGSGGHIGFTQSVNGGGWSNWAEVNAYWTFAGNPHAIYNPDTKQVSVFARGSDGSIGGTTSGGSSWPNWSELNAYWKLTGDPTVAYNPSTRTVSVFALGSGGHIGFTQSVNGGGWSNWAEVNAYWTFAGNPHAIYNPDTKQVSVFARGSDGSIGGTTSGGSSWPNWSQLNGYWKLGGDPTATYNLGDKDMTVFARGQGTPAQIGDTQNINNGGWTQWNSVNTYWTFVGP